MARTQRAEVQWLVSIDLRNLDNVDPKRTMMQGIEVTLADGVEMGLFKRTKKSETSILAFHPDGDRRQGTT